MSSSLVIGHRIFGFSGFFKFDHGIVIMCLFVLFRSFCCSVPDVLFETSAGAEIRDKFHFLAADLKSYENKVNILL